MRDITSTKPALAASLAARPILQPLFDEFDRWMREARGIRRQLDAEAVDRRSANELDRAAAAAAMRAGKTPPADAALQAHDEKVKALKRQAENIAKARELVVADVERQLRENGAAWAADAQAQADQARAAARAALEAYRTARLAYADLQATADWLSSRGETKAIAVLPSVRGLSSNGFGGVPYTLGDVLNALDRLEADGAAGAATDVSDPVEAVA